MTHSLHKKIGIASIILMSSVFLSRIIGLLRDMVVAYIGGMGASVDAYRLAFIIPDYLNHLAAGGFLSITFIPIFSGYLSRNREEDGWRIFSIILNCIGSVLIVLVIIGMIFTPELIDIVARGRVDPEFRADVVRMTRIILPAQLFFFAGGLFMAIQYAKEKFLIPALNPLIYNLGIILGGLILGRLLGMEGFCWGVLAGAFAGSFLVQMWGAGRAGVKYRLDFGLRHPDFLKYIRLTLPLMVGFTMIFSMEFLMKFFAAYLPEGNVAALVFSWTITLIPVGLLGQAVATASFPFMARLAVEDRVPEMNSLINTTLRYLALVIPLSVVLIVVRHEIVQVLFQRGKFNAADTELAAGILIFLLPSAFALAAYTIIVRGYYAMQNTLFPALFGTMAVIASLPLYWYGMRWFGGRGVASASSAFPSAQRRNGSGKPFLPSRETPGP
jgi:putative peptidoglycan lipid II flippase